jgi:regulator of cell morphogenesis and NO signaling
MRINGNTTVREIALHVPGAVDVFEQAGIDYCCGGERTMEWACREAGISLDEIGRKLGALGVPSEVAPSRNWQIEPLFLLTSHIVNHHHQYVRRELPRLSQMASHVTVTCGQRHPQLFRVEVLLRALTRELTMHMMKEEQILFPYIAQIEENDTHGEVLPTAPFGSVDNPIRTMLAEHDSVGEMLRELRQVTSRFVPPSDACTSFHQLYVGLRDLEADLHQHIHLENNVLFPRTIELETNHRFAELSNI